MKDHERMSHKCSFSPWSSTFKASSAASGGHALVISDVYLSSGRDKQSILLLSSPPLQQTSADFSRLQHACRSQRRRSSCAWQFWQFWPCSSSILTIFHSLSSSEFARTGPTSLESNESCRKPSASKVASRMAQATLTLNEMHLEIALRSEVSGDLWRWTVLNEVKRPSWGSSWGSSCGSMWRKEINIEMKSQMLQQPILSKSTFS